MLGVLSLAAFIASGQEDEASCSVAHVQLHGILLSTASGLTELVGGGGIASADAVMASIRAADKDDAVVAVVLDIDSPGGLPVAGDDIMQTLRGTTKPTVAVIRDIGTSAAYWAAAGADYVVASPVSDVGSIGVTMSYREVASSTEYEGSRWIDLSSGAFKDAGNPERMLRSEEHTYFQGQVAAVHAYMIERIATARPALTREALATYADGRSYLGSEALDRKLIDKLGSFPEALAYVDTVRGEPLGTAQLCDPDQGLLAEWF